MRTAYVGLICFLCLSSVGSFQLWTPSRHNSMNGYCRHSPQESSCWHQKAMSPTLRHERRRGKNPSRSFATVQGSTASISSDALEELQNALELASKEITKTCNVRVAKSDTNRLGLFATKKVSKGDVLVAMPYEEFSMLTADLASKVVFQDVLSDEYETWTGETGLIALLLLHEVARTAGIVDKNAIKRTPAVQSFMQAWVKALPRPDEMDHPLLWSENDQEILQSSTTNKIYRQLDDLEDDSAWLEENVFSKDTARFPSTVVLSGADGDVTLPCFSAKGFAWAMALAKSRTFFLDGCLRLVPIMDMCNHDDYDTEEVQPGFMGTFGTTKGTKLLAGRSYNAGEEVFCSYGPKSASDYLLEHGFAPDNCWKTAVSELTFELDPEDRFYDDKLDILEFETYEQAPMDPSQSFDIVSAPGRDGEPDPALIQFVRLCKLGATDAFLLESIFRNEVWGFMALPVSEPNELLVVDTILEACERALNDFAACPAIEEDAENPRTAMCAKLRESEIRALTRTMDFLRREKEALDLKEYYQERRLKDLGLDSQWSPEDDVDPDLGFGQTRAPGGADYDW